MIEFTNNRKEIVELWQEAFEDSIEDIEFFLDNCLNKRCLAYIKETRIASMLFLIEASLNGNKTKYIYAASSSKKFRKNGYMSELLDYVKEKYENLCLIPATEKLLEFYKKRGFSTSFTVDKLEFNQAENIRAFLLEGCNLNPIVVLEFKK